MKDENNPLVSSTAQSDERLARRLIAAARYLLPGRDKEVAAFAARGTGVLATELALAARNDIAAVWLLFVCLTSVFPDVDRTRATARALRLATRDNILTTLLEETWDDAARWSNVHAELEIVSDRVVVDVNFSARNDFNTGIQRVVRQTMPLWYGSRPIELVCWTDDNTSMRTLTPLEVQRVTDWNSLHDVPVEERAKLNEEEKLNPATAGRLVVPFRTTVVFPEVPEKAFTGQLSGIAACSGNRVAIVGHDAIPVVSAEYVSGPETNKFAHFLPIVKHARRVAGVSCSAAQEFKGFSHALSAQGLPGPDVVEVLLGAETPPAWRDIPTIPSDEPLVLVVGSREARKNHIPILYAAERLWSDGLQFTLRFVGTGGGQYVKRFDSLVHKLRRNGRHIEVLRRASDAVLGSSYRQARFSVFPSLHEGFGLPVVESLAMGTPVVTSNYGSMAEIAAQGGCITVDPRDDDDLIRGMRTLLESDEELTRLTNEARNRPERTWGDYADELWVNLIEPLLDTANNR